jgi:plasmid maintenance system killer protein
MSVVIRSFRDKTAEAVFNGESPKGFPADLVKVARRKLRYLNAADDLGDLRSPPGIRLEALTGDRPGAALDPHQRPIPGMFRLDGARPGGGRDRGLSLRGRHNAQEAQAHASR